MSYISGNPKPEFRILKQIRTTKPGSPSPMGFGFRIFFLFVCLSAHGQFSNLKGDQEVVFFPTLACRCASNCWELTIHGCVYEPEKRTMALAFLRAALGLEHVSLTPAEDKLFAERARLFMVDHKAGEKIVVRIGEM